MTKPSGEFEAIKTIQSILGPSSRTLIGIGDDAAVCESPKGKLLFCSDAIIENTHFRLEWSTPEEIGHKALATALSDIAAMNGRPLYAVITLALRPDLPSDFVKAFYNGVNALAHQYKVEIVGGDLSRSSSEIFIDVAVVGETSNPFLRSGAKAGDLLVVSGQPGKAAAGLWLLQNQVPARLDPLRLSQVVPTPRFDLLPHLQIPGLVTSMIDISDGLASEVHHLSRSSKCGLLIDQELPVAHPEMKRLALKHKLNLDEWICFGGESYELLFTVDKSAWESQLAISPFLKEHTKVIGRVTSQSEGVRRVVDGKIQPLEDRGWNHFLSL